MFFLVIELVAKNSTTRKRKRSSTSKPYSMLDRIPHQVRHLSRIVGVSNVDCIVNLRMDRNTFGRLCSLLRELGGLKDSKYVSVEEQVATFLGILAHHKKNRIAGFDFSRSGQTISRCLHVVLMAILKLHGILLVKPEPISENCTNPRWKWFKGCLGALDGTYISDTVSPVAKRMYEPMVVSDDEEIISPMCASYSASRCRLFDEDSGESPAKVYGSVPPPNFFPRKPIDLKDSPFKGNKSTSSSSIMKWWNKS